jgi:hypothetical protein
MMCACAQLMLRNAVSVPVCVLMSSIWIMCFAQDLFLCTKGLLCWFCMTQGAYRVVLSCGFTVCQVYATSVAGEPDADKKSNALCAASSWLCDMCCAHRLRALLHCLLDVSVPVL